MKLTLFLFLFCLNSEFIKGQVHLTTPLEILTFMEASPTQYQIEQLYGDVPNKNHAIIPHGSFTTSLNGREYQGEYIKEESPQETAWRKEALALISVENPNYQKARKLYEKILKKSPLNAQIYTFVGETYYEEKDYYEAQKWFEQAIKLNPIDYLARWLLAEIYLIKGEFDAAKKSITLAHIYNRNHPRLFKRFVELYNLEEPIYYNNWAFEPKTYIYKDGETVVISADGIWLTYGMYKAVWNYEPDYDYVKVNQAVTDYMFQLEMEAIIGTYMTYHNLRKDDKRNYPTMSALGDCLDNDMVEEYVMYEILLVDNPRLAYHTTEGFLERLILYLEKIRGVDYVNVKK